MEEQDVLVLPKVDGKIIHIGDVVEDNYGRGIVRAFGKGKDGCAMFMLERESGKLNPRHVSATHLPKPPKWEFVGNVTQVFTGTDSKPFMYIEGDAFGVATGWIHHDTSSRIAVPLMIGNWDFTNCKYKVTVEAVEE